MRRALQTPSAPPWQMAGWGGIYGIGHPKTSLSCLDRVHHIMRSLVGDGLQPLSIDTMLQVSLCSLDSMAADVLISLKSCPSPKAVVTDTRLVSVNQLNCPHTLEVLVKRKESHANSFFPKKCSCPMNNDLLTTPPGTSTLFTSYLLL